MGCGHSKINIYSKRVRNKTSAKKTVKSDASEVDAEEITENECEIGEKLEDSDRKTIRVKPLSGPLLAQKEISSSQQNFFKMLEEKIANGPDYDSTSEQEIAVETARLGALLRDWETASSGSRSLPTTPRTKQKLCEKMIPVIGAIEQNGVTIPRPTERPYSSYIPQSVLYQTHGAAAYRQTSYATTYHHMSPPMLHHPPSIYPTVTHDYNQTVYHPMHNQLDSPARNFTNCSPKRNIPYESANAYGSSHKSYLAKFSNGELLQQQMYNQQLQYQQAKECQQYKQAKEQQQVYLSKHYQSGMHVPLVQTKFDDGPLHKKQYELT